MNTNNLVTIVSAEMAKFTLTLAMKLGLKSDDGIPFAAVGENFEYHLLVDAEFLGMSSPRETVLLMINRPWSGLCIDLHSATIEKFDFFHYAEVRTWLNFHCPAASRPAMKLNEAWFLVDLLNISVRQLDLNGEEIAASIEDSHLGGFDVRWKVDRKSLAARIRSMRESERHSLWDSIECLWSLDEEVEDPIRKSFNIEE